MDYLTLFKTTDVQDGGENLRCFYYRQGGDTQMICRSRYPMLFVLRGSVEMRCKYTTTKIEAGHMIVFAAQFLTQYRPSEGAVVLIYRPPLRLSALFEQSKQAYEAPCSMVIPILPQLYEWIDRLLEEHMQGKVWIGEDAHEQRRELARVLMSYPPRILGDLHMAFWACAIGDCDKCSQNTPDAIKA